MGAMARGSFWKCYLWTVSSYVECGRIPPINYTRIHMVCACVFALKFNTSLENVKRKEWMNFIHTLLNRTVNHPSIASNIHLNGVGGAAIHWIINEALPFRAYSKNEMHLSEWVSKLMQKSSARIIFSYQCGRRKLAKYLLVEPPA